MLFPLKFAAAVFHALQSWMLFYIRKLQKMEHANTGSLTPGKTWFWDQIKKKTGSKTTR